MLLPVIKNNGDPAPYKWERNHWKLEIGSLSAWGIRSFASAEPRRRFAAMMSGLDIHYDLGEGHPLLGHRMPDLGLETENGTLRVSTLLHNVRLVLLDPGEPRGFDISPLTDRVPLIDAKYAGPWELPAIGAVTVPAAVLIRPDGYVAWVGDQTSVGSPTR